MINSIQLWFYKINHRLDYHDRDNLYVFSNALIMAFIDILILLPQGQSITNALFVALYGFSERRWLMFHYRIDVITYYRTLIIL